MPHQVALSTRQHTELGQRESATARLEKAVVAFRHLMVDLLTIWEQAHQLPIADGGDGFSKPYYSQYAIRDMRFIQQLAQLKSLKTFLLTEGVTIRPEDLHCLI
jgi:hypothetical protein